MPRSTTRPKPTCASWRSRLASFVALNAIPIAAKWLLIGRWKEEVIPIWSLRYFRFWLVKDLIRSAPMALFVGSPIYNVYLRLLGAKVGRNTVIQSKLLPVCTDLISIGDNTILRKDVVATGYKAQANYIHTGAIRIGDNAFVGEASVLDIDTAMEDNAQLGHASSLQVGQRVAQGKHYHGSPAQETSTDFCKVEAKACTPLRRTLYSAYQLVGIFAVILPVAILLMYHLFPYLYRITSATLLLHDPVAAFLLLSVEILLVSAALFVGVLAIRLLSIVLVPRFLHLFLREDKTYVLYGVHYLIYRSVSAFSNSAVFNLLFGDSSYIVNYLGWVGYRLNKVVQTGANFGLDQRHDNPFLCDIGSGTMVSDGLTMTNVAMSSTSFKLGKVRIGDHSYLGNNIYYPAAGKTGANCLLGTKVMVPIDGPVRENVGLLGSPCFEIPRVVDRDKTLAMDDEHPATQRLGAKNRYNILTMAGFLLSNWLCFFTLLLSAFVAVSYFHLARRAGDLRLRRVRLAVHDPLVRPGRAREPRLQAADAATRVDVRRAFLASRAALEILRIAVADRCSRARRSRTWSRGCLGVRVGRKVFDDGCRLHDKTLIEIGDCTNLNEGCVIQGHSLEEGVFKSDYVKIGNACSIGSAAFVHYGVIMGDNVVLDPDSFLMKGEILDPGTHWRGNPAKALRERAVRDMAA